MRRLRHGLSTLLAVVAVAFAAAASASAADLPVAPAYYPPVYRPAFYDWTGIYLGGHAGLAVQQDNVTYPLIPLPAVPPPPPPGILQAAGTSVYLPAIGEVLGTQVGANFQKNSWVVGVEGTFSWALVTVSKIVDSPIAFVQQRSTSTPRWYVTAAGRVGYAFDDWLFYTRGGIAIQGVTYTQDLLVFGGVVGSQSIDVMRTGFTVGGGFEYGITEHLSAKIEYDFLKFAAHGYTFDNLNNPAIPLIPVSISSYTHLITAGVNYRFTWGGGGGGGGAVVTKY